MIRRLVLVALTLPLVAGCSMFGFGSKDEDAELLPTPLVDFDATLTVKKAWSTQVGGNAENLRLALSPATDGSRLFAAGADGTVMSLDPENGRDNWTIRLETELSAGPAVADGYVAVVSKDGDLIALDADSGEERWRKFIDGESLARPLIRNRTVIIVTVDNRLRAYGLIDGRERWTLEESTPALTLRGNASPVGVSNSVVAGFDNGRVMAVEIDTGNVLWQQMLSPPTGRSDLERLADVDGAIAVVGQDIYAAGYQGRIAALAAESGQGLWARELSTFVGLSADFSNVYTALEDGEIVAMSRRTGTELWRNESMVRREPTLPVPFFSTVAVADLEGYVHFLSNETGEPVARAGDIKAPVTNAPIVLSNRLFVQGDNGSLTAYELAGPRNIRRAPDIADDGA